MNHLKKNRETLAAMILRSKNRYMELSKEKEEGIKITGDNDQIMGIAFPDSELSLKWAQATISLVGLDTELAKLQAMFEDRDKQNSLIARPTGPIPLS